MTTETPKTERPVDNIDSDAPFNPYPLPFIDLPVSVADFDDGGKFEEIEKAHDVPDISLSDIDTLQYWLDNRHRPLRRVTLKELGSVLPIGQFTGGELNKSLTVGDSMSGKDRRKLAKLQSEEKTLNFNRLVRDILGLSCTNICGHDLTSMHSGQIAASIGPLFMSDVVYAYIYMRTQVFGPNIKLNIGCSNCGSNYDAYINLDELEVDIVEDMSQLTWDYTLEHPVTWRGRLIEKITMQNGLFSSMGRQDRRYAQHPDYVISFTLASSICGINDKTVNVMSIPIDALDDWDVNDIDAASHAMGLHAAGPELSAMTTCTVCGVDQLSMLDANPLTFFRRSNTTRKS